MYIDQIIYQPDDVEMMKYDISVKTVENGSVVCDKAEAAEGDTVTLSILPAEGYKLKELKLVNSVFYTMGKTISVPLNATEVKVVMPHDNMTIQPSFTEADGIEFDWVLTFSQDTDPDVYCISVEMGTVTYHRFSREDYLAMDFVL